MKPLRIVLADDHTLLRAGLRQLLGTYESFEIAGEAEDGLEAIAVVRKERPDVLILDIGMPKMRGIEAISEIKRECAETKILVLSMHDKSEYVRQTLKNGADGYLLKKSAAAELVEAIQCVAAGSVYLSPAISREIVNNWLLHDDTYSVKDSIESKLSEREKSVMKLLAEGHSNKEVAEILFISPKTVETHRSRIMSKLDLHSVPDLVRYAIKNGLADL